MLTLFCLHSQLEWYIILCQLLKDDQLSLTALTGNSGTTLVILSKYEICNYSPL